MFNIQEAGREGRKSITDVGQKGIPRAILDPVSSKQKSTPIDITDEPKDMRTPSKDLETFPSPNPDRDYTIHFDTSEFTCLCPKTGQPDFATIRVQYIPDRLCVELKSWKLYLWSFRNEGGFHEAVTNKILDDLVAATKPRWARIEGDFNVRGGIHTVVEATYEAPRAKKKRK
jgi:7-cyano-7-deazaguanine reductase